MPYLAQGERQHMQPDAEPGERRGQMPAWQVLAIAAAFGILAWIGIWLTRGDGRIAALWLPNGFMTAVLLRRGGEKSGIILLCGFIANWAANILSGDDGLRAAGLGLCNSIEIIIAFRLTQYLCGDRPDLTKLRDLILFAIAGGLIAPAVSATASTAVLGVSDFAGFMANWKLWYVADALGMLIGVPLLWNLCPQSWSLAGITRKKVVKWSAVLIGGSILTIAVFSQSRYPFLFLVAPFLVVAAFQLGIRGTAIATILVSIIASIATTYGTGPISLVRGDLHDKIMTLQVFILMNFVSSFPVAANLRHRLQMTQELAQSRDFIRTIVENVQEVIFRADAKGRWTYLNPAWEQITGYTVAESLGRNVLLRTSRDSLREAATAYRKLRNGEIDNCRLTQRFRCKDGTWCDLEVKVQALRDDRGRYVGNIGNIKDITAQRASDIALRQSESRFQTLSELSPAGIHRLNAAGECTYVNPAWQRLTGLDLESARGMGWEKAVHPEDREAFREQWQAALTRGRSIEMECRLLHTDGHTVWAMVAAAPEYDGEGQFTGCIGVALDSTAQKTAELELARREQEMRVFADNVTDAVFRLDLDGNCIFVTPSIKEVLGYEPETLVGQYALTGLHPDDEKGLLDTFARLKSGEVERQSLSYRTHPLGQPDKWVWFEANVRLIRNSAEEPEEIIASIRDVHARKQLEQELIRAKLHAEAAAHAKATFLANMSHELRTPMNGVIGFTDLLLEDSLTSQQRLRVNLIAESGRTMMRLLNDILDISKIDAGQMDIVQEPIDIRRAAKDIIKLMAPAASEKKGLALNLTCAPDVPKTVVADGLRLRQILTNLVGNAIKFTPSGSVSIDISVKANSKGPALDIAISDSGIGVSAARREAIFDEFVQGDEGTVRKFGGTGLGLAISRKLAKLMDGVLTLDEREGPGSTFRLNLPLRAGKHESPQRANNAEAATDHASPVAAPILVVEDHEINRLLVTSLLERLGYNFETASSGFDALAAIAAARMRGQQYGAVLMDVQMPEIDGLETTRRVRAMGIDGHALPIIALTAHAYSEDIAECLDAGMQAHLAKPLQLSELATALGRYAVARPDGQVRMADQDPRSDENLRARYQLFRSECLDKLQCPEAVEDGPARDACRTLMHKLSGTAALFGEGDMGALARKLEVALEAGNDDVEHYRDEMLALLRSG